jgi:hypothetical protein
MKYIHANPKFYCQFYCQFTAIFLVFTASFMYFWFLTMVVIIVDNELFLVL